MLLYHANLNCCSKEPKCNGPSLDGQEERSCKMSLFLHCCTVFPQDQALCCLTIREHGHAQRQGKLEDHRLSPSFIGENICFVQRLAGHSSCYYECKAKVWNILLSQHIRPCSLTGCVYKGSCLSLNK